MTNIIQDAVVLNSQNQLRNADRLAREWAIAHAGAYKSQAANQLGGSLPFREWKNDNLTIRMAKLTTGTFKQVQLYGVHFELSDDSEPYIAYVMTYTSTATEDVGGYCIAVSSVPDALGSADLPWGNQAGPMGLEKLIETTKTDRSRPADTARRAGSIASIDDLFSIHDTAVVLTEEGQQANELCELADAQRDWATVISVNGSELISIGRQLTMEELYALVRSKIALFRRYADGNGHRLIMAESECEIASALLNGARERARSEFVNRSVFTLMEILESTVNAQNAQESAMATDSSAKTETVENKEQDLAAAQQRIYILKDQLSEAEQTISALREQLAQHEDRHSEEQADDPDDTLVNSVPGDLDVNRALTVLNAVGEEKRFPRLRFLAKSINLLEDYGKPRPNGVEILKALDAINLLAEAWHNTPSRNIGSWAIYFGNLPGWKYAADESETTMSRFGDKRSFSDQEQGRQVTITRHLTYQGSSGGLQIYFDRDDVTDSFIIGYIGEHLPYATARS